MKWIYELPVKVRNEVVRDAVNILTECCDDDIDFYEAIENVMCEKIINVIGYEKGLLDADKYAKYLEL